MGEDKNEESDWSWICAKHWVRDRDENQQNFSHNFICHAWFADRVTFFFRFFACAASYKYSCQSPPPQKCGVVDEWVNRGICIYCAISRERVYKRGDSLVNSIYTVEMEFSLLMLLYKWSHFSTQFIIWELHDYIVPKTFECATNYTQERIKNGKDEKLM